MCDCTAEEWLLQSTTVSQHSEATCLAPLQRPFIGSFARKGNAKLFLLRLGS